MRQKMMLLQVIAGKDQNHPDSSGASLSAKKLGLSLGEYGALLEELLQENLISGVDIIKAGQCARPVEVYTGRVKITPRGRRWLQEQESGS